MLEDEKVSVFLQSPCPVGTAAEQERFRKKLASGILALPLTQKAQCVVGSVGLWRKQMLIESIHEVYVS